jgi:hypothetical protein
VEDLSGMTIQKCIQLAEDRGLKYAAVQIGTWCHAGNDISAYVAPGKCDRPCSGNPDQKCGGPLTNAIYLTRYARKGAVLQQPNNMSG